MAALAICCRTEQKTKRVRLRDVKLDDLVSSLRKNVSKETNVPCDELELLYCGRLLHDDSTLQHYGIKDGVTVHALRKIIKMNTQSASGTAKPEQSEINNLVTTLQKYMKRTDFRIALENLLTTSDVTKKLSNLSELQEDPVALGILREPSVLSVIADSPENIKKAVDAHPGLVSAIKQILEMAATEATNHRLAGLDAEEEALTAFPTRTRPRQQNQSPSTITATQLSAALAAAASSGGSPANSSPGSSSAVLNDQAASNDEMRRLFHSHAGQQAAMAAQTFDQQIETLRGMGIADEALARTALQQTGGNIDAALGIIFGDSHV